MRISHITLSHFLNHRTLNVPVQPDTRVLFVCGENGAGKSGVAQAIKLALTGTPVRGLQYKNQLSELITQGEKDGLAAVTVLHDGKETVYRLSLRTGNYSGSSPELPGDPLSLDPDGFVSLDANERRKLLFRLAGIQLKPEAIVRDLVDGGHDLERVQRVTPAFRHGFDAAVKEAQTAATEARGGWKAITGENYGSAKADGWRATEPVLEVKEPVDVLQGRVNEAKATVERLRAQHDSLRQAAAAHAAVADSQQLRDQLATNETALGELRQQREELGKEADAIKQAAQYKGGQTCPCPKCGEILYWNTVGVLKVWDEAKPAMPPPQAHAALQQVTEQLQELDRRIARVQQAVADGKAASKLLANLPDAPEPGAVRTAEGKFQQSQAELAIAQADLNVAVNGAQEVERAKERTKKAAIFHADVGAFAALAEAIQELPVKYLTSAITGVQTLLDEASAAFEQPVTLGQDMELRYGTVPYGLASESQQWRMRAAMGYALAVVGGLGMVVLDRFDVLQPKSRGGILKWLSSQQRVQVVLCGTLKELPKLPEPPFQLVWLAVS